MTAYDARVTRHCRAGEQPVVSATVRYHAGRELLGEPPGSWAQEGAGWALGVGGPRTEAFADRLIGGVSLRGWPGCWAQGLRDVVDRGIGVEMALTDQRVLVLPFGEGDQLLWTADRGQVTGLRRASRPLQRGRLRIDLADGSVLMVITGLVFARSARRLASGW